MLTEWIERKKAAASKFKADDYAAGRLMGLGILEDILDLNTGEGAILALEANLRVEGYRLGSTVGEAKREVYREALAILKGDKHVDCSACNNGKGYRDGEEVNCIYCQQYRLRDIVKEDYDKRVKVVADKLISLGYWRSDWRDWEPSDLIAKKRARQDLSWALKRLDLRAIEELLTYFRQEPRREAIRFITGVLEGANEMLELSPGNDVDKGKQLACLSLLRLHTTGLFNVTTIQIELTEAQQKNKQYYDKGVNTSRKKLRDSYMRLALQYASMINFYEAILEMYFNGEVA